MGPLAQGGAGSTLLVCHWNPWSRNNNTETGETWDLWTLEGPRRREAEADSSVNKHDPGDHEKPLRANHREGDGRKRRGQELGKGGAK